MFNIRDHGGVYGEGKYRKNSIISSWNLSPFIKDISSLLTISSPYFNDYRPTLAYDDYNKRYFLGCGILHVRNGDNGFIGTLGTSGHTVSDIIVAGNKVFLKFSNMLMVADTTLTTYTQIGLNMPNGIIHMEDSKVYVYGNGVKGVYVYDPSKSASNLTHDSIIMLSGVLGTPQSFTRDKNNFYLANSVGQIQKFSLSGALVSTFETTSKPISNIVIEDGFLYYNDTKWTVYKMDTNTGNTVWSYTKNVNDGYLATKLNIYKDLVCCPSTGDPNMRLLNKKNGQVVYSGFVGKNYTTGASTSLSDIKTKDGIARMVTMMGTSGSSYLFDVIEFPLEYTIKE